MDTNLLDQMFAQGVAQRDESAIAREHTPQQCGGGDWPPIPLPQVLLAAEPTTAAMRSPRAKTGDSNRPPRRRWVGSSLVVLGLLLCLGSVLPGLWNGSLAERLTGQL